jgi:hypothetical protein
VKLKIYLKKFEIYIQGIGENLYMSRGKIVTGATVVESWYKEIHHYPSTYGENARKSATGVVGLKILKYKKKVVIFSLLFIGHFTQVIWKASVKLGVGISRMSVGIM